MAYIQSYALGWSTGRRPCYRIEGIAIQMRRLQMKMTELFLAELERELPATRRVLERVPEGRNDWKPHEKSMAMGHLAALVASMFGWVAMTVNQEQLELKPGSSEYSTKPQASKADLLKLLDKSADEARAALRGTT